MTDTSIHRPGPEGHVVDDLPLLLAGEAGRDDVRRVGTHLRACADCRDDLVEAVVAHATLASAARVAPDVATGGRIPVTTADARSEAASVPDLLDAAALATPPSRPVDLSPVFAQIRAEAAERAGTAPVAAGSPSDASVTELSARRGRRLRYALVAAAAVVVVGGGAAVAVDALSDDGRAVTVSAYGAGTVDASARIGDGWVTLDAGALPELPRGQFYEAWLVNPTATGVVALGPLGADRTGSYAVPPSVMAGYSTLQVTVQQDNGDPTPSDTSVLRATL